jgi:hypothetical protein
MCQLAYVTNTRSAITRRLTSMLSKLHALSTVIPLFHLPDDLLMVSAIMVRVSRAYTARYPQVDCLAVRGALLDLESFLSRVYNARFSTITTTTTTTTTATATTPSPAVLTESKLRLARTHRPLRPVRPFHHTSAPAQQVFLASLVATDAAVEPTNAAITSAASGLTTLLHARDVLSAAVALGRESVVAGLMNFFCAQQSLLEASRAKLQSVIDYGTKNAEFATSEELSQLKSDILSIDANLALISNQVPSSFEATLLVHEKMHLISSVFTIQNIALGQMHLENKTRAFLLSSCGVVVDFLTCFAAQLDAGDGRFWSDDANLVLQTVGIHAVNAMLAIESDFPVWFFDNSNKDLMEASDKMKDAFMKIHGKMHSSSSTHGSSSGSSANGSPSISYPSDLKLSLFPAPAAPKTITIQRLDSDGTDGNATPLSEAGAVLCIDSVVDGSAVNASSEEDDSSTPSFFEKSKKKKKTAKKNKSKKNKKNFRTY